MSYTALYRKWRPEIFSDVKGQNHIVTTLKNQIETNRIGHAYLFCGTRGTGKTTIAKIFARAVNCEHPVDGSPCGECDVCRTIANGSSLNVVEIDAASNNGVDNIRQIREEVMYRPTEGRYKVYIIDEVHMLSIGAFNALLKTLEEPPEYVIFILATTEVHKIPVTIMSRCQRYDFKRISVDTITDRLRELTEYEHADVEDKALRYIAKMADGAMRDALSLLDRCMSFYIGQRLEYRDVLEVLGAVDTEVFSVMLRDIINGKVTKLMESLENMILLGRDLTQFTADFTWYVRNLLMLRTSPEAVSMMDMTEENIQKLQEEAFMITDEQALRYIRILSELSSQLKVTSQKRIAVEVALIKMANPRMEQDTVSMSERIRRLEDLVKGREELFALGSLSRQAYPETEASGEREVQVPVKKQPIKAVNEDIRKIALNWHGIIGRTENTYHNFLKQMRITAEEDRLVMVADNSFVYNFMIRENHREYIQGVINDTVGKEVPVDIRMLENNTNFEEAFTDLEEYVKMDISMED